MCAIISCKMDGVMQERMGPYNAASPRGVQRLSHHGHPRMGTAGAILLSRVICGCLVLYHPSFFGHLAFSRFCEMSSVAYSHRSEFARNYKSHLHSFKIVITHYFMYRCAYLFNTKVLECVRDSMAMARREGFETQHSLNENTTRVSSTRVFFLCMCPAA
jgi:hypothetical protein